MPNPSPHRTRSTATPTIVAGVLLALTLAAGVAARIADSPGSPAIPDPDALGVSADGGPVALRATLDRHAVLAGSDGRVRVELVLTGREATTHDVARTPTDLVVVLDRSGSMSGEPLDFARAAVFELLGQLQPEDRFGLVTYATGGRVAIGLEHANPTSRARWRAVVEGLGANGGTNMARGLDLAHGLLSDSERSGRSPRVVLISDGHANQGDHSLDGLRARAARAVPGEYVLSSVGVGQGFDETVMSAVSDAGTGNFYYLPDLRRLAGVFADEFAAARERVARALEVRVEPGDGVEVVSVGGLPLERDGHGVRFRPGDLFAGQERRLWLTLRAPTHAERTFSPARISLGFADEHGERRTLRLGALPEIACVPGEQDYYAAFDGDVYRRGTSEEGIGFLKQSVAAKLKAGRPAEAAAEVESFQSELRLEQMRALGYVVAGDAEAVQELHDRVSAPSAAEPSVQNQLGKELLEAGRDARRVGSKRK